MPKTDERTDWRALPAGYLSPSSVWGYLACPYCWYLERVERIPKPVSVNLMIGRCTHAAVAHMRLDAAEEGSYEQDIEVGVQAFDEVFNRKVAEDEDKDIFAVEIELGKKFGDIGQAKDAAVSLTRFVLPQVARYDRQAGVLAAEARVRHLGPSFHGFPALFDKMSPDEQQDAREESEEQFVGGIEPVFPFPFKAYLDVIYNNGWLYDLKTSSRNGSPDSLAALQLLTYALPWWKAGQPLKLGWHVAVKTRQPDFAAYIVNGTGDVADEQYVYARDKVIYVAEQIVAGNFPINEASLWHKYEHPLPSGERALMNDWSVAV